MPIFFISHLKNIDHDFEVHHENCAYLPLPEYRTLIGEYKTSDMALSVARKQQRNVNACYGCLREHHKEIALAGDQRKVEHL